MIGHISLIEVEDYLQKGKSGLVSSQITHLQSCDVCRRRLNEQQQMHRLLLCLQPQAASENIIERLLAKLPASSPKALVDWVFIAALLLLVAVGLTLIFTGVIEFGLSEKSGVLQKILFDQMQRIAPQEILDSLPGSNSLKKFALHRWLFTKITLLMLLSITVLFFYFVLDRYLGRRFRN